MAGALRRGVFSDFRLAIAVTVSCVVVPVAAKITLDLPRRLLEVGAGSFLVWSAAFWVMARRSARPASGKIALLLLPWIAITGLSLAVVYRLDRAGWLWSALTGYEVTLAEDLSDQIGISPVEFAARHPFFSIDPQDSTRLVLRKGEYQIGETMVIPQGSSLIIEPGAVLRFRAGRSLISYGPIIARGTEGEPILFTAQNPWLKWGAVGVVHSSASIFDHVRFEHGRGALVNQIEFKGGLSLIESDVEISHSEFLNQFGKDAVYVLNAQVLIRQNLFQNAVKDGLDLDGGGGEISHNRFINCGDEEIDLSEDNQARVFGNQIHD